MVISGGVNIYPAEIEAVLLAHPDVVDAAVFGVPDERWGESLRGGRRAAPRHRRSTGDALQAWCRERLADYKCPRSVRARRRAAARPERQGAEAAAARAILGGPGAERVRRPPSGGREWSGW